jgi:acyl-CoA synthetase (NDP forming)
MLSSDLTMSQRSVPFAFMVSAGNQSVLTLEDFIDVLSGYPGVRAIGLHIEGIRDVARFSEAVFQALERHIPIVALKTGTSEIGARLTISHTGSLSGTDDLYQALFRRLGIIRVATPAQLLETLKFLCVAGVPEGNRVAGFTCSGGSAAMLADYAETIGLAFPAPGERVADALTQCLPHTATVSNPLDYTTPIWGIPERTRPVFETMFRESYHAAVLVQDYPLAGLDESKPSYINDAQAFIAETRVANVPAAVCSTLPENIDRDTREMLIAHAVAPMQGIRETLDAIAGAVWYGRRRQQLQGDRFRPAAVATKGGSGIVVDEWKAKTRLRSAGVHTPEGCVASGEDAPAAAAALGFPVALKMLSERLPHKTEAGAVALGLSSEADVRAALERMREHVRRHDAAALTERFLVEKMIDAPVAELLVNLRADPQFGFAMTLASGGVLTELVADAVTILLPAGKIEFEQALARLKLAQLLCGFRGRPTVDRAVIIEALSLLADHVCLHADDLMEVEINPLFVLPDRVCAIDVFMRVEG